LLTLSAWSSFPSRLSGDRECRRGIICPPLGVGIMGMVRFFSCFALSSGFHSLNLTPRRFAPAAKFREWPTAPSRLFFPPYRSAIMRQADVPSARFTLERLKSSLFFSKSPGGLSVEQPPERCGFRNSNSPPLSVSMPVEPCFELFRPRIQTLVDGAFSFPSSVVVFFSSEEQLLDEGTSFLHLPKKR